MRKALLALAVIISLLGAAWGGHYKGYGDAYGAWEAKIEETTALMAEGTYQMAWTNVRACVLAVDSAMMRFVARPSPDGMNELRARYTACEEHWELLFKYAPKDEDTEWYMSEARWMFDNWGDQLGHMLKLTTVMLNALNTGETEQAERLYVMLIEERIESKKFRDHIEQELFNSW